MDGSLSGKVALVTGATKGLGRSIATAFSSAGATVIVTSRDQQRCDDVAARLSRPGGPPAIGIACHVGRWSEVETLVQRAYQAFPRVDVLVSCAGMSPVYESLTDVTEQMFDRVIGVNLRGPFRLVALMGARMAADGAGSIINVSAVGAVRPTWDGLPYSAAKAGLDVCTVGLARAYGPNVRVNSIMPGPFRTDIARHWSADIVDRLERSVPLGRIGEPSEINGAALYLAQ